MSSSGVAFVASKFQEEESEEGCDSDEESYRRSQQRLLKKVEESVSAIRALRAITRPFITGTWRLEKEEAQLAVQNEETSESSQVGALTSMLKHKHNSSTSSQVRSSSCCEKPDGSEKMDSSRRRSLWSPVKHFKTAGIESVLEMEKTPSFKPLRKSKARHSLAFLNMENSPKTQSLSIDSVSSSVKPLGECTLSESPCKLKEEHRTPLRAVVGVNQSLQRRGSVSQVLPSVEPTARNILRTESAASDQFPSVSSHTNPHETVESYENDVANLKVETLQSTDPEREESFETPIKLTRSIAKNLKSPVRFSPILCQAFGEEFAKVRGSIVSPEKMVNLDECGSPKDPSRVLKGVIAYVEVRRGEDDRTDGFKWKLRQLGASVSDTLNKRVTHVVFQEGLLSTFRKAKQIGCHLVSTHWVMACDESFTHVTESRYPIENSEKYELADPLQKTIKRPKIMSPDLGSDQCDKILSKKRHRKSIRLDSPLTQNHHKDLAVVKTPSPKKSPLVRVRSSPSAQFNESSSYLDDDWDGFLAMVEAKVREKAESRRKENENECKDFETRLKELLGCGDNEVSSEVVANAPLASIFQKGKASALQMPMVSSKRRSPRKTRKALSSSGSADASSSMMMNWLQKRSPANGQDSLSAAAAASAAADEILATIFNSKNVKESNTHSGLETCNRLESSVKRDCGDSVLCPMVFTAKAESKKVIKPTRKAIKQKKLDSHGNAGSAGVMKNWLSGIKSPPLGSTQGAGLTSSDCFQGSEHVNGDSKKRQSFFLKGDDNDNEQQIETPTKKRRGDVTPKKNIRNSRSSINSDCKSYEVVSTPAKNSSTPSKKDTLIPGDQFTPFTPHQNHCSPARNGKELTTRRRSMRLTPVKSASVTNDFTPLQTVKEMKESTSYNQNS